MIESQRILYQVSSQSAENLEFCSKQLLMLSDMTALKTHQYDASLGLSQCKHFQALYSAKHQTGLVYQITVDFAAVLFETTILLAHIVLDLSYFVILSYKQLGTKLHILHHRKAEPQPTVFGLSLGFC